MRSPQGKGSHLRSDSQASPLPNPEAVLVGRETILRNGEPVGYLTSGGFGYTLGRSVGYGYVRNPEGCSDDFLMSGHYSLVVASEAFPARDWLGGILRSLGLRVKA